MVRARLRSRAAATSAVKTKLILRAAEDYPQRHTADHRPLDTEFVEQGHDLAFVPVHAVLGSMVRLVAGAVTEQVEEHDPETVRG